MIFGSLDSTGVGAADMITLASAVPPLGWTRFTALDSKFPQGAATYGGTGGTSTHGSSHSVSHTGGASLSNTIPANYNGDMVPPYGRGPHPSSAHAYSNTLTATSNLPPYLNTVFIKRNDPVGAGITTTVEFDNSCEATLDDTSHTIKSNCSFENTLAGMDPGTGTENTSTLILESGILTINNGYTVVAGSYNFTGGSIALADTGAQFIIDGVIYYSDADADGYPSSTTTEVAFTTPANKHRRNVLTSLVSLDCNDSNDTIYQNLDGYMDSDGDNHGTGDLTPICSGETLPDGYTTADNVDCNDSNDTIYQNITVYVDSDGDGYGSGGASQVCASSTPSGYATVTGDCSESIYSTTNTCNKYISSTTSGACSAEYTHCGEEDACPSNDYTNANNAKTNNSVRTNYDVARCSNNKIYTHIYDLGGTYNISKISLFGYSTGCWSEDGQTGGCVHNDNVFTFYSSTNNSSYSIMSPTSQESCNRLDDGCWRKFSARNARYIKVQVTSGCWGCDNNDYVDYIVINKP